MQLSISTTTAACSVALLDGITIVEQKHEVVGRGHAERLIPMIQAFPCRGRAQSIWIDCGPGSFTGTRVGLAAARALALAWGVPIYGFSSLSLIAASAVVQTESFAVAVRAGHGELFVQEFAGKTLTPVSDIRSLSPDVAARFIRSALVLGSGAEALVKARGYGTARDMLPYAADARNLSETLRQLPPRAIYVRAPDARAA